MIFLMGLNDSFAHIRGQLLLMDPMPNMNHVFSLVLQEESQRAVYLHADPNGDAAFAVRNQHPGRNQGNLKGNNSDKPYYTHCQYSGHTKERCYKLHGYPPGYKTKQQGRAKPKDFASSNCSPMENRSTNNKLEA